MRIKFKVANNITIASVATVSETAESNVLRITLMDNREYLLTGNTNMILNHFLSTGYYAAPDGSMKFINEI